MKFNIFNFLSKKISSEEVADAIGASLTSQIWLKELALQIVTSYIANTISKCEIKTFENNVEVHNELYYLLNVNPNPNQNSSQFVNMVLEKYIRNGSALVVPYKKHIYCADGYGIQENPTRDNVFTSVSIENLTLNKSFKASDVFFFKLENRNAKLLIDGLYNDYADLVSLAIQSFKSGSGDKYKLILDNVQAGDQAFNKMYNDFIAGNLKSFMDNDRAVYLEYRGTKLERFGGETQPSASTIIDLRKEVFEIVSQAYRIPQSMMYGNITNMNEIVRVFLTFCIDPIAQMISEELTRKTTTFDSWRNGSKVVVDTSRINHIDIFDIADGIDKLVASSFANINDLRKQVGWEPIPEEFADQYFITKNYQDSNSALDSVEGGVSNE